MNRESASILAAHSPKMSCRFRRRPKNSLRRWPAMTSIGVLTACLFIPAATSVGALQHTSAPGRRCGKVKAHAEHYAVYVSRGRVTCQLARHVIEHTLTTRPISMGSPGRPPKGWQCGWNYYKFPHGDTVRAGAACSNGPSEVFGYWRPHLLHCQDVSASSTTGATFTAHDIWAYRLNCHTSSTWIATFFSSVANPAEEAYTGSVYGCGTVSGHNAGCVGTSGTTGEVNFELHQADSAGKSRPCKGINGPIAIWARNVSCRFAVRFVEHVNTVQLYRHPKPYRYRGYRCGAHRRGVELYSRCVKRRRLIRFQTGP